MAAVAAVVGVAGLLLHDQRREREVQPRRDLPDEPRPTGAAPAAGPLPDVARNARLRSAGSSETQRELETFIAVCAQRGAAAVPALLELLRARGDQELLPRWKFAGRGVDGFPTLRSAYLKALAAIPDETATAALHEVLAATESLEESVLLAGALLERNERGVVPALLERTTEETSPLALHTQRLALELAAEVDPAATARRILELAPRGRDGTDPRVSSHGLRALPLPEAAGAAEALLGDAEVTRRAKSRYLRALANRAEPEVFPTLLRLMRTGAWDAQTREEAAYAAASSTAFLQDAVALQQARARGETAAADGLRRRYLRRLEEVTRLANAALETDVATATDQRAQALRRLLDNQRKRIDLTR